MRTTKSKNQKRQIPAVAGRAERPEVIINEDDVNYTIKKLSFYEDHYSTGVVAVFNDYLLHKDYKRMRDELETVDPIGIPSHKLWDFNAHIGFLDVIYPNQ